MSEKRPENLKAGVFVLTSVGVLVAFMLVLMGKQWFRAEKIYYTVFDQSVQGLDRGSPVKYLGVPAGTVDDIRFKPGEFPKIRVTMKLADHVSIKEGTRAMLAMTALTGIGSIELVGGKTDELDLADGSEIPAAPSFYQKLFQTIPDVVEKLPGVLENIQRAAQSLEKIFNKESQEKFASVLSRADETVATLQKNVESTGDTLRREMQSLSQAARDQLNKTSEEVRGLLAQVREEMQGLSGQASVTIERLDQALVRLDGTLRNDEHLLSDALYQLRESLREAGALLANLKHDPASLLFSAPPQERKIPDAMPRAGGSR